MEILKDSNREKQKLSSQTAVEITIVRSNKSWRYYRGTRKEFTDTIYRHNLHIQFTDTIYTYNLQTQFTDTIYRYNLQTQCTDTIYRHNFSYQKKWEDAKNDKQKLQ